MNDRVNSPTFLSRLYWLGLDRAGSWDIIVSFFLEGEKVDGRM